MKTIIVELKQNEMDEFHLQLPEDLLIDLEWFDKTKIEIKIESDNSITLTKVIEKVERIEEERIFI
jgi:hypothetical protein